MVSQSLNLRRPQLVGMSLRKDVTLAVTQKIKHHESVPQTSLCWQPQVRRISRVDSDIVHNEAASRGLRRVTSNVGTKSLRISISLLERPYGKGSVYLMIRYPHHRGQKHLNPHALGLPIPIRPFS